MTHPDIRRRFMALLGVDQDYEPGNVIQIRGNHYIFPSWTAVFDAARGGGLKQYQVKPDARPLYDLDDDDDD